MIEYPTKILLATDGGEDSVTAAEAAVALSNKTGAELHVVNVGQAQSSGPGVTVEGRTASAEPYETIVERARRLLEWQVEQIREYRGHRRRDTPEDQVAPVRGRGPERRDRGGFNRRG
ncbi:MAG: universal stress protein [Actinomycetota bacterium]|nr:universal stress protein [Actinomycetota bacterium]